MISTRFRRVLLIGLGMIAGAVLPATMAAQVPVRPDTARAPKDTVPTRPDTAHARQARPPQGRDTIRVPTPLHADSMVKNDSIMKGIVPLPPNANPDSVKRDTIKAPLAHAEAPLVLEIGVPRVYDRTAMFATGALTLSDLLGRVPGLTEFTTGWLAAPAVVASQGDLRLVRVFLDGLELDPLERRGQGISPVNDLSLYSLEELRIERGAEEVRVYARSWRVDHVAPYTRADVALGDQSTTHYRAFFGRRYDQGEALQIAAEQYSTQPDRQLPLTDVLHIMGRFGTTHGPWSLDLFGERGDADRGNWVGTGNLDETRDTVNALQSRRITAYARFGNGDPDRGRWFQLLAAAEGYRGSAHVPSVTTTIPTTIQLPDSTTYENQFLFTGGTTLAGVRLSAAERIRRAYPRTSHVLSGRASFATPLLAVSAFAEGKSALYPSRAEGTIRIAPLDRMALVASASRTGAGTFSRIFGVFENTPVLSAEGIPSASPVLDTLGGFDSTRLARYELSSRTNLRAEAGIRLRDLWVSGGVLRRGATTLLPPADLQAGMSSPGAVRVEGAATGATAAVRGRLYKSLNVDAWALRWNDSTGLYRPQYQSRAELYIQTNLLGRFPRGNFGLLGSLAHEYRSNAYFASGDTVRVAQGFRTIAFKLEIRIQTAVVSYQFRNLLQERYAEVPGFFMPHQTQFYGVRWDFWN